METTFTERLDELAAYEKGWLDGKYGEPLSAAVREQFTQVMDDYVCADHLYEEGKAERPGLYITEDGGLSLEATRLKTNPSMVSLEFTAEGVIEAFAYVNKDAGKSYHADFTDPAEAKAWFHEALKDQGFKADAR